MSAGHENRQQGFPELPEIDPDVLPLLRGKRREPGEGITLAAANGGRQSPDTAPPVAQLRHFMRQKLNYPERRVCANSMDAVRWLYFQPLKAICVIETITGHFGSFAYS